MCRVTGSPFWFLTISTGSMYVQAIPGPLCLVPSKLLPFPVPAFLSGGFSSILGWPGFCVCFSELCMLEL